MTVTLNISTPDAAPTQAPYKVSKVLGKEVITFAFSVTGPGPVRAWRLKLGGANIIQGTPLRGAGAITGLSRCGATDAEPTAIPNPSNFSLPIAATELSSEGANSLALYVYNGASFE